MEKLKILWALIVANKKVVIPVAVVLALVVLGSISYMAGCVKGMKCSKETTAEKVK